MKAVEVIKGIYDFHFYNKSAESECSPKNNRPYLIVTYPVKFTIFAVKLLRCYFQIVSFEISEMKLTFR